MTRDEDLLKEVLSKIKRKPGLIIYTMSNDTLRKKMRQFCRENKIPCISVVSKIIQKISNYIGVGVDDFSGYSEKFDNSYFDKLDAIDFALRHDDGQNIDNIDDADIVLVGPSRTSKTPTSVYLEYNGFKTANVPYVEGIEFPEIIFSLQQPIVFGLTINPVRLVEIRQSRMNLLQINENSNYTDINTIGLECRNMKKLCHANNWKVIDVSKRSIEETAALVMKHYYEKRR